MLTKVCGLRERDNILAIAALKPQWMGFIFVPSSPRYVLVNGNTFEISDLPVSIKKVGVFANENVDRILSLYKTYQLDAVQLHGDETVQDCMLLQQNDIIVIKAFRVHDGFDFATVALYEPDVDILLFDTAGVNYGGNGKRFDWELLNNKRFEKPFILSGGIGIGDISLLKAFHHPDMIGIDVNSKFETEPALKDVERLRLLMEKIR